MKAIVRYRDRYKTYRTKTLMVEKNELNYIVREFIKATGQSWYVKITTIKCGRCEYQWFDNAFPAFGENCSFRPYF